MDDRPDPVMHDGQGQQAPPTASAETNGLAIASLVLGIVWLMGLGSVLALVFGYVAKRQIDSSAGRQTGRGLAIAGIVLGWVGVGVLVVMAVFMLFGWTMMPWGDHMGGRHD